MDTKQTQSSATETQRRNKRRKPPNYYQNVEYSTTLKSIDSEIITKKDDSNVSPKQSSQINTVENIGIFSKEIEINQSTKLAGLEINEKSDKSSTPDKLLDNFTINNKNGSNKDKTIKEHISSACDQDQQKDKSSLKEELSLPKIEPEKREEKIINLAPSSTISWATLFKKSTEQVETHSQKNISIKEASPLKLMDNAFERKNPVQSTIVETPRRNEIEATDSNTSSIESLQMLGDLFKNHELKHSAPALQPRGIINRQNWCYINASLQSLLACPPFYNFIKSVFQKIKHSSEYMKCVPIMTAMGRYISEFKTVVRNSHENKLNLFIGEPFDIHYFYNTLTNMNAEMSFKSGRQEDAQEFLSFLLNKLNDEISRCLDSLSPYFLKNNNLKKSEVNVEMNESDDDDDWNLVGKKNRSHITRKKEFKKTPISSIFGGQLRTVLSQPSAKSKDTLSLEPFFTLPLDIQSNRVQTVQEALDHFVRREEIYGFKSHDTKQEIEAFKRIHFEELPQVLILYLKCFIYDKHGGIQKLLKRIEFQIDLEINKEFISPTQRFKYYEKRRTYKLFAVEYHHGDKTTGGHYITDVYHPGIVGWVRYDDSKVTIINNFQVLKSTDKKLVPYLLLYRRTDLI